MSIVEIPQVTCLAANFFDSWVYHHSPRIYYPTTFSTCLSVGAIYIFKRKSRSVSCLEGAVGDCRSQLMAFVI